MGVKALSQVHAGLAWAAIAVLAAAIVAVARRARWGGLAVGGAVAIGLAAFATGAMLHLPFQAKLRQRLFLTSAALGWLFERKEHAAFGAAALLACAGCATIAARASRPLDPAAEAGFRRAAIGALAGALAFEAFAIGVSIATAGRVGF